MCLCFSVVSQLQEMFGLLRSFNDTCYRGIHADVIFCIFDHLHIALQKEGNISDMN